METTIYHIGDDIFEDNYSPIYRVGDIIEHHGKQYIVTESEKVWSDGEGREEGYSVTAVPYNGKLVTNDKSGSFGITFFSAKEYGWGKEEGVSIAKYLGSPVSSLVIPNTIDGKPVLAIEDGVFSGKWRFAEIIIPDTVMKIGEYAYAYNPKLEKITLPQSLRAMGRSVFQNCIALKEIVIPDNVTGIAQDVFMGCSSLERVVLPLNLKYVLPGAFQGCNRLKTLQISEKAKDYRKDNLPNVKIELLK